MENKKSNGQHRKKIRINYFQCCKRNTKSLMSLSGRQNSRASTLSAPVTQPSCMLAYPATDSSIVGASSAFDAQTGLKLPTRQLFHSQCWKHIEAESHSALGMSYDIRAIAANKLKSILEQLDEPLSAFCLLQDYEESLVASIERWLCNRSSPELASWNRAMTGKNQSSN